MTAGELTQARLKELLDYNPETGVFTWKVTNSVRAVAGTQAVGLDSYGYVRIGVDKRRYKGHQLAFLYMVGVMPSGGVDHINGIKRDNRWVNLRESNQTINMHNLAFARSDNKTTGLLGTSVRKDNGKVRAYITAGGKQHHLGLFDTAEQAHAAYLKAKHELHPTHQRLRTPPHQQENTQ